VGTTPIGVVQVAATREPRSYAFVVPAPDADSRPGGAASVLRKDTSGVTVLRSAEGPSLRSDPRWTSERAARAQRLLGRLVAARRAAPVHG
jgi:hypothetical protein